MDSEIADDREFVGARSDKEQHPVSLARLLHAHLHETPLSSLNRVLDGFVADKDAEFAGGLPFGLPDRSNDFVVVKLSEEILVFHTFTVPSPTASGAAAAKTAAAA
jgi:hypothetical protein